MCGHLPQPSVDRLEGGSRLIALSSRGHGGHGHGGHVEPGQAGHGGGGNAPGGGPLSAIRLSSLLAKLLAISGNCSPIPHKTNIQKGLLYILDKWTNSILALAKLSFLARVNKRTSPRVEGQPSPLSWTSYPQPHAGCVANRPKSQLMDNGPQSYWAANQPLPALSSAPCDTLPGRIA